MITYSELCKLPTYELRLQALMLNDNNYKSPREKSMNFFKSNIWRPLRRDIIMRDLGYDLGVEGVDIYGKILVHHIDPIELKDIETLSDKLLNPENLITVSLRTHNIIHYGKIEIIEERKPGDTILW